MPFTQTTWDVVHTQCIYGMLCISNTFDRWNASACYVYPNRAPKRGLSCAKSFCSKDRQGWAHKEKHVEGWYDIGILFHNNCQNSIHMHIATVTFWVKISFNYWPLSTYFMLLLLLLLDMGWQNDGPFKIVEDLILILFFLCWEKTEYKESTANSSYLDIVLLILLLLNSWHPDFLGPSDAMRLLAFACGSVILNLFICSYCIV